MSSSKGFFPQDIDFSNIDDIAASLNACAFEIEHLPGSKESTSSDDEPAVSELTKPKSQLELPVAPSVSENLQ